MTALHVLPSSHADLQSQRLWMHVGPRGSILAGGLRKGFDTGQGLHSAGLEARVSKVVSACAACAARITELEAALAQ